MQTRSVACGRRRFGFEVARPCGLAAVSRRALSAGFALGLAVAAQGQTIEAPTTVATAASSTLEWGGEARIHADLVRLNGHGPLAESARLAPGLAARPVNAAVLDTELHGRWRPAALPALSLQTNVLLSSRHARDGATASSARSNEFYASSDLGAWQLSAGKKLVGWDVGYGFRPNDLVQQEVRHTLLTVTQEGRPLIQAEHFDADTSTALVWVNPHRVGAADDAQRFAQESAVAARWYRRDGAMDHHLFARIGQHTGASAGAALAWVATDTLALHASARLLQRHDGWAVLPAAGSTAVTANPWSVATLGGTQQGLVGAQWTGEARQSVLVEAWHDGTAMAPGSWRDWAARNAALVSLAARPGLPAAALTGIGGNLAWQTTPLDAAWLHRDNAFVRLAWQPEPWQFTLDALVTPTDRGRMVTAGVGWQGNRVRLTAAWRVLGGPAEALFRQLPQRRQAVLAATFAF